MSKDWTTWLKEKLKFQIFTIGVVLAALFLSSLFSKKPSPSFKGRYPTPPEKCYCEKCGAEIDMRKYGLYGKHCREIEICPVCGGGGRPLWRMRR